MIGSRFSFACLEIAITIDLVDKITDPIKATLNEAAIKKAMKADE
tara:strand:+ start:296 stop:430 length:135 start_codon:yes stop_codon:yes gene_type:complete